MSKRYDRREFLSRSAVGGAAVGLGVWSSRAMADPKSANDKLNIAMIGTANQARFSINNVRSQNIVALCDIDDHYLGQAKRDFPQAKTYNDFRKLLEQNDIDAVVVATPDHVHALATAAALHLGKHVYCEKPLTHTVYEARKITELAAKMKVATQMGTQIHASDNYRRVVEIIQSGAIGPVAEVHTWAGRAWGGVERPKDTPPVPPYIHWNLWIGPAPMRPYNPAYLPANWRKLVGFRRRQHRRHGLPSHGSSLLGARPAPSHEYRSRGPKVNPEVAPWASMCITSTRPAAKSRRSN